MTNGDAFDPRAVLDRSREAAGGSAWDGIQALHWRVQLSVGGLSGPAEFWEDLRSGRYASTFSLGPMNGGQGFDGEALWALDGSGQVRTVEGGDARAAAVNDSYRRSLAYWYPERKAAAIASAGESEEDGRRFQRIAIHPEGGRPFELWIDAATGLVDRFVEPGSLATRTTFLSDYRQVDGIRLPFRRHTTLGDPRYDEVAMIESVEVDPPLDEARLRRPGERQARDFEIAGGGASTTVPCQLVNNHVSVEVFLDGHGPLLVPFDTGGANVVTPETAARLGLASEGTFEGRGAGEGAVDVGLTRVRELRLGDVALRDQLFYVMPRVREVRLVLREIV